MEKVLHKSDTRGHANHGWLNSYHTFSFANYYHPERMHFGVLRVLNDDTVAGGKGFGTHPHENMEIISIPLEGSLRHEDSMGNKTIISAGEVQVMSAGTGVAHSEFNAHQDKEVKFLQIWLFPKRRNVEPRYDQIRVNEQDLINKLCLVVSPDGEKNSAWIHQDAWFCLSRPQAGNSQEYKMRDNKNLLYLFVLEGDILVEGESLGRRDGLGLSGIESVTIKASEDSYFLLMEVPGAAA